MSSNRWFFLWLIPLAWAGCSLIHFRFPGDEYALYFISSMAGAWLCLLVQIGDIHQWWIPVSIAVTGAGVMAAVGWVAVRWHARKDVWLGLFLISTVAWLVFMLTRFPSLERAVGKNGSLWAYVCSAMLLGSYAASIFSLVLAQLAGWREKGQEPEP